MNMPIADDMISRPHFYQNTLRLSSLVVDWERFKATEKSKKTMTKIKKAKQAVLNQAMLNPDDFEFFTMNGRGVTITHKETRKSIEVEPRDGVIRMGGRLEAWTILNDFPKLDLNGGEYVKVWSELKDRGEI